MGRDITKITPLELLEIQQAYENKTMTVPKLRQYYGISDVGLRKLRKRHGWKLRRKPKAPQPKKPVGRPSGYDSVKHPTQAKELFLLGLTFPEVAKKMMVPEGTLRSWARTYPDFSRAIADGRENADKEVAKSLFARATGYTVKEEKIFCYQGEVTRVETLKHYPPDVRAQEIWLARRRPEVWRESRNVDLTARALRTELPVAEPVTDEQEFQELVEAQAGETADVG